MSASPAADLRLPWMRPEAFPLAPQSGPYGFVLNRAPMAFETAEAMLAELGYLRRQPTLGWTPASPYLVPIEEAVYHASAGKRPLPTLAARFGRWLRWQKALWAVILSVFWGLSMLLGPFLMNRDPSSSSPLLFWASSGVAFGVMLSVLVLFYFLARGVEALAGNAVLMATVFSSALLCGLLSQLVGVTFFGLGAACLGAMGLGITLAYRYRRYLPLRDSPAWVRLLAAAGAILGGVIVVLCPPCLVALGVGAAWGRLPVSSSAHIFPLTTPAWVRGLGLALFALLVLALAFSAIPIAPAGML